MRKPTDPPEFRVDALYTSSEMLDAVRRGEDEMQAKVRELMTAIHGQVELAAALLYADGVAAERMQVWIECTDRGILVDDVQACTVSTRLTQDLCFEVQLAWHEPYTHLADCDEADDAAKLAELRKLVT